MAMTYRTRIWLHGAVAALVNGFFSSVAVVIVDPTDFNLFGGGGEKLLMVCAVSGIVGLATYLKAHPLPDPDKDSDFVHARAEAIAKVVSGTGDGSTRS